MLQITNTTKIQHIYVLNRPKLTFLGPFSDMETACRTTFEEAKWDPSDTILIDATGKTYLVKERRWMVIPDPDNLPDVIQNPPNWAGSFNFKDNSLLCEGVPPIVATMEPIVAFSELNENTQKVKDRYIGLDRDQDDNGIDLDLYT